MAKAAYSKLFVVGKKRINKVKRDIISQPLDCLEPKPQPEEVKRGKKREARFQAALAKGDIISSDMTVTQLRDKKNFPTLVSSFENCMNEAELRNQFPKDGIGHNFFMGGHKFKYYVANDKTSIVCQVLKEKSPI